MPTQFGRAASVVAAVGALVAIAVPFVLVGPRPFSRSVVASGVLALVFAAVNAVWVAWFEESRFAPGIVAAALGVWLVLSPTVYEVEGTIVGGVQVAGALLAAFAAYTVLEAFEGF
ncbi:MAG: hypothetical protein ABEH77_08230 [Halobacteriaceae archaeon]